MNIEKLSQVVTFLPKSKIKAGEAKDNGKYVFFTSSDTKRSYIDKFLYDDELVVLGTGGFASCNYYNGKFAVSTDNFVIKPKNNLLPKYLYYYLRKNNLSVLNNGFRGIGIKHISKDYVMNISIPMTTLDNQKSIINNLDNINETIEREKQCIIHYDELIKSRFIEMFGTLNSPKSSFDYNVLENVCHKITDGKHGGCTFVKGTKKYFVGAREIYNDKINYETAPEISEDEFEKDYKRCNLQVNDFIIVNTGATIGKSAIVKDERAKDTLLQKSVALIKVKEDILNNIFLKYCYIVNPEMYNVESGSAQPNLLLSKIKSTKIYIPNINLQNEFACFAEKIDKLKFNCQQRIKLYQELLDKKMDEYFG